MSTQPGQDPGGWKNPNEFPSFPQDPIKGEVLTPDQVKKAHTNADTDGDEGSLHHTLGPAHAQASPGDHDHRGSTSVELLKGVSITGSRSGGAALVSVIAALVQLGATDSTTT